jgi:peptidoglycan/xylan/chitin deacetylase (PgdA/CDA1 family)
MSIIKSKLLKAYHAQRKLFNKSLLGNCAVLLYHRVTNIDTDPQLLVVKPHNFDNHIKLIKNKYNLLSIEELQKCLVNKTTIPPNSIAITFDDGYADNYLQALPVLEKNNAQALFYIATATLNTKNEFWWDAIERIILLSTSNSSLPEVEIGGNKFDLENLNSEKKRILYEILLPILRNMIAEEREKSISLLAKSFSSEKGRETHRAMTYEELKLMSKSKSAVIGAHTHSHPSLGGLTYEQQKLEIQTSKEIIEEIIGKSIRHFSYPFGTIKDYNEDTIAICKKLGFNMVAANYPALVNKKSNLFSFPRFLVRDWDVKRFENELDRFLN